MAKVEVAINGNPRHRGYVTIEGTSKRDRDGKPDGSIIGKNGITWKVGK